MVKLIKDTFDSVIFREKGLEKRRGFRCDVEGPVVLSYPQKESESSTRADGATQDGKGQEKGEQ